MTTILRTGLLFCALASQSILLSALAACKGPPARLVAGIGDTVVVNNLRPVRVPMRVLDAAGHVLPDTGVRYLWTSGVPVSVSRRGVVTCTQAGDATPRYVPRSARSSGPFSSAADRSMTCSAGVC